ncbi:MAG: TlpA family protein disulfide reductase [Candidatus Liptonbacteria bacterium]|nr:TlpA family protein disulfide reductase [Candidatus Liptonbacteria bacterium]
MWKFISVIVVSAGIIGALVWGIWFAPPHDGAVSDLARLGALRFADYEGSFVSLADFSGKALVVNSWAVWCPFCKKELEDFARLQETFGERVAVVAVDRAEPLAKSKEFTDSISVTGRMTFLIDPSDSFYKAIGGFSMPETLFIDRDGRIAFHKRGPLTFEDMQRQVEALLGIR